MPYLLLFLISLGHAIVDLCGGVFPMLLPIFKNQFYLTYTVIGQIVLIFNLSSSLLQPLFGIVSDRIPCRWLMPFGCILAGGIVLTGVTQAYSLVLAGILLCGVGLAAYHPEGAKQSFMISGERQAAAQSIYAIGGNLGAGLGPITATFLLALSGLKGLLWLFVPVLMTTALIFYNLPSIRDLGRKRELDCQQTAVDINTETMAWGAIIILLLVVTMRSVIYNCVTTFVPLYFSGYHKGSQALAGLSLSGFLLAGVLGSAIAGPLADRWGRKKVLLGCFLMVIPPLWLFPYTTGVMSVVMASLTGFALIATAGITTVIALELIPGHIGLASGLVLGLTSGLSALGVLIFGALADVVGLIVVFKLVGVLSVVLLLLTLVLPEKGGSNIKYNLR